MVVLHPFWFVHKFNSFSLIFYCHCQNDIIFYILSVVINNISVLLVSIRSRRSAVSAKVHSWVNVVRSPVKQSIIRLLTASDKSVFGRLSTVTLWLVVPWIYQTLHNLHLYLCDLIWPIALLDSGSTTFFNYHQGFSERQFAARLLIQVILCEEQYVPTQ